MFSAKDTSPEDTGPRRRGWAGPLTGGTAGSTSAWLLLMHLVVAVPLVRAAVRLVDDRTHP